MTEKRYFKRVVFFWIFLVAFPMWSAGAVDLLDPLTHPKFVNPLPIPARIDATQRRKFNMEMRGTIQWLGLVDGNGRKLMTTVWGYGTSRKAITYPGPTFVARKDVPVRIKWKNKLPKQHLLPIDYTIHLANPAKRGIAAVTHLHGGHTESASDGLPEAWYTQGFKERGPHFVKKAYWYDNDQEAATLWYHDHALGITRLNVYAGLAGFYLLRDDNEDRLVADGILPAGPYEIEIVIQDRMFSGGGQLFYPTTDPGLPVGAPSPSVLPEFFGNFILVNGMAWPVLEVEPRKYRFRFLNGSDSRFYVLEFSSAGGAPRQFYQIGTDVGFLDAPVALTQLVFSPGERADLIVDFSGLDSGTEIILRNFGPDAPFKGFPVDPNLVADPGTTGQVMVFRVNQPLSDVPDASIGMGTSLRETPIDALVQNGATRQLILFEDTDEFGRLKPILGTVAEGKLDWFAPITENPMLDDVEVWEVYNTTEDAHPIHLHLVAFQIISREGFTADQDPGTAALTNIQLNGDATGPAANEAGWKDTAQMLPGQVTRVIAKFDREGRYVWHCHILSHEDHEMMRPYYVGTMPPAALARADLDERRALPFGEQLPARVVLEQNSPNPFNPMTEIRFQLPVSGHVDLKVYDILGLETRALANRIYGAGVHSVIWDGKDNSGSDVPSGVYVYRLRSGDITQTRRMVMIR